LGLTQVVVGDRANVIVPVVLDLKERGKPNRYDGFANVVLLRENDRCRRRFAGWFCRAAMEHGGRYSDDGPNGNRDRNVIGIFA
jgi:hypothetical protein